MRYAIFLSAILLLFGSTALAGTADVVVIVDESGSMNTEHNWLPGMISSLDQALIAAGFTGNRYGLVGFGSITHDLPGGLEQEPHSHLFSGSTWGTAADFATPNPALSLNGGTEDGWAAIAFALGYSFRSDAAVNFILVTDEDRDDTTPNVTYQGLLDALIREQVILNAVINGGNGGMYDPPTAWAMTTTGGDNLLGMDGTGRGYLADGSGGYTTTTGTSPYNTAYDYGETKAQYVDLAWATGGVAWDLTELRAGNLTASSFTAAFVDVKVEEIQQQAVPLPASAFMGFGLLAALGLASRIRRRNRIA